MKTFALTALLSLSTLVSAGHAGVDKRSLAHKAQAHQARAAKREEPAHGQALAKRAYSGQATFYNAETGNQGACGGYISNSDWKVAISTVMYGDTSQVSYWCGKSLVVTGNGKTTTVVVADACPSDTSGAGCGASGLDMTPDLFSFFTSQDQGVMAITWYEAGSGDSGSSSSSSSSSKWVEPTTSSSQYTPEWTPSSSSYTPEWTPSSSSYKASSSKKQQWTSSSSSSKWTPSSSSWTPAYTPSTSKTSKKTSTKPKTSSYSKTSSSSVYRQASTSAPANLTATTTHLANATLATTAALNSTATLDLSSAASNATGVVKIVGTNSTSVSSTNSSSSSGGLESLAQAVLDIAGLAYAAAESS